MNNASRVVALAKERIPHGLWTAHQAHQRAFGLTLSRNGESAPKAKFNELARSIARAAGGMTTSSSIQIALYILQFSISFSSDYYRVPRPPGVGLDGRGAVRIVRGGSVV